MSKLRIKTKAITKLGFNFIYSGSMKSNKSFNIRFFKCDKTNLKLQVCHGNFVYKFTDSRELTKPFSIAIDHAGIKYEDKILFFDKPKEVLSFLKNFNKKYYKYVTKT